MKKIVCCCCFFFRFMLDLTGLFVFAQLTNQKTENHKEENRTPKIE